MCSTDSINTNVHKKIQRNLKGSSQKVIYNNSMSILIYQNIQFLIQKYFNFTFYLIKSGRFSAGFQWQKTQEADKCCVLSSLKI